jgi:predicted ribosomally synthesized peptide with nif11-like leader
MDKERLQTFAEAVSKNEELRKQFVSIQVEAARSTAEQIAKLSESAGTPFTAEEYLQSVADSSEELSADQLQNVAGGAPYGIAEAIALSVISLGVICLTIGIGSAVHGGDMTKCDPSQNPDYNKKPRQL